MTILLDENFPLGLLRHLRAEGLVVELTDDGVLVPWRDMPTATGS